MIVSTVRRVHADKTLDATVQDTVSGIDDQADALYSLLDWTKRNVTLCGGPVMAQTLLEATLQHSPSSMV